MMRSVWIFLSAVPRYFVANDAASPAVRPRVTRRFRSRRLLSLLGWPGVVGIGLLAMLPPFYFSAVHPMQKRLDAALASAAPVTVAGGANSEIAARRLNASPDEQLNEFYQFFPGEKNAPKWLGKMVEVAEKNGLSLNQGEYAVTRDKAGQLTRFRISLPVEGKYLQVRKFLANLTREIPTMALENVQFERKDIVTSDVQVKIKLVLYLGRES